MYEELKPALSGKSVVLFGSYGWGDGEWMRNWTDDCAAVPAGNFKKCGHHVRPTDCADCFAELKAAFSRQR